MEHYGIWTMRSGNSVLGAAEAWSKRDGIPELFSSKAEAQRQIDRYNANVSSPNVRYDTREMEPELAQNVLRQRNSAIAQAIDKAVSDSRYDTYHYNLDAAAKSVVEQYGAERVNMVLANILLANNYDGRYSAANKEWARGFDILPDNRVFCNTHPHVLDGFIDRAKEIAAERENPLAAAEMNTEQNYNQIDGLHNNIAAPKADLTDGQTLEEIKELAPEMLPVEEQPEPRQSPPPKGRKFENVDIIAALGAVVAKNTVSYQTDFDFDKELFTKAAESPNPEDKNLLWLSRHNGTECSPERNVYFTGAWEHSAWTYYDASQESLAAFAVKVTGMEDGKVIGSLYELDHSKHVQEVKRNAEEPATVLLTLENGAQERVPFQRWKEDFIGIRQEYGVVKTQKFEFADEPAMQAHLKEQRQIRDRFPVRSFGAFLKKLPQQERPSVTQKLNEAKQAVKPPAPGKKPPAKTGPER